MGSPKRLVLIDPQTAGIAGDMLLGALVDLGADVERIRAAAVEAASHLSGCRGVDVKVREVRRYGIRAKKVGIEAEEDYHHRPGGELLNALEKSLRAVKAQRWSRQLALNALTLICDTEAALHATTRHAVELHEMGSVDTVAEIAGVAVALEDLDLAEGAEFYSLPVNVGRGKAETSHGVLSAPTIDLTEILRSKGFPFEVGLGGQELATPTGVSLLVSLARPAEASLGIRPSKVGYGAGSRELDFAPNVVRVIVGEPLEEDYGREKVLLVETNLDDVDGEMVGHVLERLFGLGVKDAWVSFGLTKKSRPTTLLSVLTDRERLASVARLVFEETGTLGLRFTELSRFVLEREVRRVRVNVGHRAFDVRVKVSRGRRGGVLQAKPEFDDIRRISEETGRPLRHIRKLVAERLERSSR